MNPDRWREISRIYGAVLTKPESDRPTALASLCRDDAELRAEVESLLQSGTDAALIDRAATERPSTLGLVDGRAIGTQIGVFRIDSLLGVGGMGEVYRARDTKLNRDVAIKILPPAFASDPDRLARFKREAQVLASLNHPNIGAIHGFEDSGGIHALVLELVEGPTLADMLDGATPKAQSPTPKALPVSDALAIAGQIANALEAAHELGIVHRDLKPANIKVRDGGTVKVLDFGLAKVAEAQGSGLGAQENLTQSPTITTPAMTAAGMILGTAAYMSPEQAKGKPADKRSDIWAFGVVLFEMLTGERPFQGDDVAETLAEVIKGTPDWTRLPALPPAIRLLVQRCLEKDPKKRLADVSAIQLLLSEPSSVSDGRPEATPQRRSRWTLVAAGLAGAMLVVVAASTTRALWMPRPPAPLVSKFSLMLPASQRMTNTGRQVLAISRDGRRLAYTVNGQLWLKSMDEREPRALTDGARAVVSPAFSPDGQSVAFWSAGAIYRVAVGGGTPITITVAPLTIYGVQWTDEGIYYGEPASQNVVDGPNRIRRTDSAGGTPVTLAESAAGQLFYGPSALPGGRGLLVTLATGIGPSRWDQAEVVVILPSGERKVIVEGASDGRYLANGLLAYSVGGVVFAAPFDLERLSLAGASMPILEGVARGYPASGATQYSVSSTGTLVFVPGPATVPQGGRSLAAFSMDGGIAPLSATFDQYEFARVSPDGKRIAVGANSGVEASIWIVTVDGSTDRRRLATGGRNRFPIWSPDGQRLAFQSDGQGDRGIFTQAADSGGTSQRVTTAEANTEHIPSVWIDKGRTLLYEVLKGSRYSIWSADLSTGKQAVFIDAQSVAAMTPTLSPDGKWLAYHTRLPIGGAGSGGLRDNGGLRDTVWVRPYPLNTDVHEISSEGTSHHPLWLDGGRRLLLLVGAGQLVVRELALGDGVSSRPASPIALGIPTAPPAAPSRTFDLLPDGRIVSDAEPTLRNSGAFGAGLASSIELVQNWFEELKAKGIGR